MSGLKLVAHTDRGPYSWAWATDPASIAEAERMAARYAAMRERAEAAYQEKRAEYLAEVERNRVALLNRLCLTCGEPVTGDTGRLYCSATCEAVARRERVDLHAADPDRVTFCPVCDREVRQDHRTRNPRVYCSTACRHRARNRRRAGLPVRMEMETV